MASIGNEHSSSRETGNDRITKRLNAVYANEEERMGLDSVLEYLQEASVPREEW
jgi:hypothetical protein